MKTHQDISVVVLAKGKVQSEGLSIVLSNKTLEQTIEEARLGLGSSFPDIKDFTLVLAKVESIPIPQDAFQIKVEEKPEEKIRENNVDSFLISLEMVKDRWAKKKSEKEVISLIQKRIKKEQSTVFVK